MNKILLAGATALSLACLPAAASAQTIVLTPTQQASDDSWPAPQRTAYDAWTPEIRTYYWTLTPDQQRGWWMLNAEQRQRLYAMTPDQRAAAWTAVMAQVDGQPSTHASPTAHAATTMTQTPSGNIIYSRTETAQALPAAPRAADGNYPPCRGTQADNCINPREAGLNYGNRPLQHWPGQPASERRGKRR